MMNTHKNYWLKAKQTTRTSHLLGVFLALVVMMIAGEARGQDSDFLNIGMQSPTAASLGEYGAIPVGKYTGIPSIKVPLYNVEIGDLSIPIELSYHAGGIKVDELASWVGLGWSLNSGGVITRSMRGGPDDDASGFGYLDIVGDSLYNADWPSPSATLRDSLIDFEIDTQPDEFFFNVGGKSGKFMFKTDGSVMQFPQSDLNIAYGNGIFTITDSDGTKYIFSDTETTTQTGSFYGNPGPYISSWFLSRVESAKGEHFVEFNYSNPTSVLHEYGITMEKRYPEHPTSFQCNEDDTQVTSLNRVTNSTIYLESIVTEKETVTFLRSDRDDALNPNNSAKQEERLDTIKVFSDGSLLEQHILDYSYFNGSGDKYKSRLRLDSVYKKSANGNELPPYTFEYNSTSLPSRISFAKDHWGFYNGAVSNETGKLIPDFIGLGITYLDGANREVNDNYNKAGILTKITYPTGGSSSFTYESNTYSKIGNQSLQDDVIITNESESVQSTSSTEVVKSFTITENQTIRLIYRFDDPNNIGFSIASIELRENDNTGIYNDMYNINEADSDITRYFELAAGTYKIVAKGDANVTSNNSAFFFTTSTQPVTNKKAGGVRIQQVTTADGITGTPDIVTTYSYALKDSSSVSSGVISMFPDYYGYTDDGGIQDVCSYSFLTSTSFVPLGITQGSYVGYREVKEEKSDTDGYTWSYFKAADEVGDRVIGGGGWPYLSESRDYLRGYLIKEDQFSASGIPKKSMENQFEVVHSEDSVKVLRYRIFNVNTDSTGSFGGGLKKFIRYEAYASTTSWLKQTGIVNKIYDESGANYFTTSVNYEYDATSTTLQPTKVTEKNSDSTKVRITKYKFAHQEYSDMADSNMLSQPYSVTVENNTGDVLSKNWTVWSNQTSGNSNWNVRSVWEWVGNGSPADTTAPADTTGSEVLKVQEVTKYDSYGNPLIVKNAKGNETRFFFGTNDSTLVNSPNGVNGTPGVYLTGIQKSQNGADAIPTSGNRPSSGDDLFSEALYDNLGRLITIKDENNKSQEFTYDSMNRLQAVYNQNRELVNSTNYFYSSEETGNFNSNSPNAITAFTPDENTDYSFASSSGWTSSGDFAFNISYQGETTMRLGANSTGGWSYVRRYIGTDDFLSKVDFYPTSTTDANAYVHEIFAGSERFIVRYNGTSDRFDVYHKYSDGTNGWDFSAFEIDAPPNTWYTIEVEKDKNGTFRAWVYPKNGTRNSHGDMYELSGFSSIGSYVRFFSKVDHIYFANYSVTKGTKSITYLDGLGRPIQSQTRAADGTAIVTGTLYDVQGRAHIASRPIELDVSSYTNGYVNDLWGTGFTAGAGAALPTNSEIYQYYDTGFSGTTDAQYAYTQTQFENSPLSRPVAAGNAAAALRIGQNDSNMEYGLNSGTEDFSGFMDHQLSKTTSIDPNGNHTFNFTDGWGNTIASGVNMDPSGTAVDSLTRSSADLVTEFQYDLRNQLKQVKDPRGLTTDYTYNQRGQLVEKAMPDKDDPDNYRYDSNGNLRFVQSAKHKNNGSTTLLIDQEEEGTYNLTMPGDGVVEFDVAMQVSGEPEVRYKFGYTDGNALYNNVFDAWETSGSGTIPIGKGNYKLEVTEESSGYPFTFLHDLEFKPYKFTYSNYDELSRITETGEYYGTSSFSSVNAENDITGSNIPMQKFHYGEASAKTGANNTKGRLSKVEYRDLHDDNLWGITWYSYNTQGLVEWIIQDLPGGVMGEKKIEYVYDELGRMTEMKYQSGTASEDYYFRYSYDELGRLSKTESRNDPAGSWNEDATYAYFADGQVEQVVLGNSPAQSVDYTYGSEGWLDKINDPTSLGTDRFGQSLSYNHNGNISSVTWNQSMNSGAKTYTYTYDRANRLTVANQSSGNAWDVTYAYDKNGGITDIDRKNNNGGTESEYEISMETGSGASNRIDNIIDWLILEQVYPEYDANGNMTKNPLYPVKLTNARYDSRNLPYLLSGASSTVYHTYDADGQRVSKKEGSTTTSYIRGADGQTIAVYENGSIDKWNILSVGDVVGTVTSGGAKEYFVKDHLGSTRTVVNSSGTAIAYFDFYPYGKLMPGRHTTSNDDRYKFTGHELDTEAGLDLSYAGARYLDSEIGTWLSIDPLADSYPGWSPYNYTMGNPINMIDPSGMSPNHIATNIINRETNEVYIIDDGYDFDFEVSDEEFIKIKQEGDIKASPTAYTRWYYTAVGYDLKSYSGDTWFDRFMQSIYNDVAGDIFIEASQGNYNRAIVITAEHFLRLKQLKKIIEMNPNGKIPGTEQGGGKFKNLEGLLPAQDNNGNVITYQKYDINPKTGLRRDGERMIRGSDGRVYYTPDHYKSFMEIKD
ncbi:MAG: RHS repeat-associated core domain-containing protein [Balneola sp.]